MKEEQKRSRRFAMAGAAVFLACAALFIAATGVLPAQTVTSTITVGTAPNGIGVNTVTNRAYVVNRLDSNVSVVDCATDTVIGSPIAVGTEPFAVAVNTVTNKAYVTNISPDNVSVIDGATNTVTATVPVGNHPHGICVNPVTNKVYVGNWTDNSVTVIDGATDTVIGSPIAIGGMARGVCVNPDTNVVYATNQGSGIAVIDGDTNTVTSTIALPGTYDVSVNPITNRVYAVCDGFDSMYVIDGATDTVIGSPVIVGDNPTGVGVNPATDRVYVTNYNDNDVSVIDGATNRVLDTVGVGAGPIGVGIGVNPDTSRIYVSNETDDTVSVIYDPVTWYLAEGCTAGGFETWVLVQNPGATDVTVDLNFMTSTGEVAGPQGFNIPAGTRHSFNLNAFVTDYDVSTKVEANGEVVCERAMYGGGRTWAHDSIGVTRPDTIWYLAEGCTGGDFETWVLVQNPGASDVTVDLTFMTSTGEVAGPQDFPVQRWHRHSFRLNDYVTDWDVSTKVVATGGVICERAVYGGGRTWAHDSIGASGAGMAQAVTATVPVGDAPQGLNLNPNTNRIYATNQDSDNVSVIDGATNTVTATIPVGNGPYGVGVNPGTDVIYVSNHFDDNVSVIDGATSTVTGPPIAVGDGPWSLAVNPLTNKVYVGNWGSGNVSVIDGATNTVTATIPAGNSPSGVAVNPLTNVVYVPNYDGDNVSVIDGATDTLLTAIPVGANPEGIGINPVTNVIYVANNGGDSISVIDGATNTVTETITGIDVPVCVGLNPLTGLVYTANKLTDSVTVIDGATNEVAAVIPVGDAPYGVGVNPGTNTVYTANVSSGDVSVISGPRVWYLAEGCTAGDFETWVLVQNPNDWAVTVDLVLMTDTGMQKPPGLQDVVIGANSRRSFDLGAYAVTYNVSTLVLSPLGDVICERAMYGGGRTWGTDSIGATSAAPTWYLAEGCTAGGFETWVLVQNPAMTPVTVDLTFMTSSGPVAGPQGVSIPAQSRVSFNVGEYVTDYNVSTEVTCAAGVICERAMYGNGRTWAHDSIGHPTH